MDRKAFSRLRKAFCCWSELCSPAATPITVTLAQLQSHPTLVELQGSTPGPNDRSMKVPIVATAVHDQVRPMP